MLTVKSTFTEIAAKYYARLFNNRRPHCLWTRLFCRPRRSM